MILRQDNVQETGGQHFNYMWNVEDFFIIIFIYHVSLRSI